MADSGTAGRYGKRVLEGTWMYADSVPTRVWIVESNVACGTGDYSEPDDASDRPGRCYYVKWESSGGAPGGSVTGPFESIAEAKAHTVLSAWSVRWVED